MTRDSRATCWWMLLVAVATAICLVAAAIQGAPAPTPKREKPGSIVGVYAICWNHVNGTLTLRKDGTHEHQHSSIVYEGTWQYDPSGRVLHLAERTGIFGEGWSGLYGGVPITMTKR